jgi:DNA-binding response OmpR family regulator
MPRHERTPVLFVTGLSSAARQITEMATEHDSYLAKPYYLNELSLKALTMILQARLSV